MKLPVSKVAVITGAASGIGEAIASRLLGEGYRLVLIDKNKSGLENFKDTIGNNKNKVITYDIDITNNIDLKICIEKIKKQFPIIDVLVNNAGLLKEGLLGIPIDDFNIMLDTHLIAAYHLVREIAPMMQEQKKGYIFNIASQSGKRARAKLGAYAISKYALVGLNEAFYDELMQDNVKVTVLCPSVTDTNLIKDQGMDNVDKIQPEDIASTVVYLLGLGKNAYVKEICIDCRMAFLKKIDKGE